jgi:hypothetical protein
MADSSTHLDQISPSQASKEVPANAIADAMSPAATFGRRASTTAVLTWGMYGGKYRKADGTVITKANATVALTDSATNYLLETDGVVSNVTAAPSGWPGPLAAGANALYEIVCAGGAVTSYTDYRAPGIGNGASPAETTTTIGALINGATAKATPINADMLGLMDSAAANILKKLSWANVKATLKTYFDGLYAALGSVNVFTKNQCVTPVALTDEATISVDASLSNNFSVTLGGDRTLANPTNLTAGMVLNFCIDQDGSGSQTLAFGNLYKFPGGSNTISTDASAKDFISCYYDGTILRCNLTKAYA